MQLPTRPHLLAALAPAFLTVTLAVGGIALAQQPASAPIGGTPPILEPAYPSLLQAVQGTPSAGKDNRACPGCPPRRPLRAVGEVFGINLLYQGLNIAFRSDDLKIYYKTYPRIWWNNLRARPEWDDNSFMINQWGHPYQGSTYFSAGRSNGLSFWESAPLAVLGSVTWEVPRRAPHAVDQRPGDHQPRGHRPWRVGASLRLASA